MPEPPSTYLFQGSNIGPDGVLRDTLNVPEMLFLMQKKFFGIPNTVPDQIYTSEFRPNARAKITNSFPYIHQTKIYSQYVPNSNPIGNYSSQFLVNKATIDLSFVNCNYSFFLTNMCNDTQSSKWISKDYPYICYYSNLLLSPIANNLDRYDRTLYSNFTTTYGHPTLVNSISRYYDFSYITKLYQNNGTTPIDPSDGFWLLDNDTGLVVFYDSNNTTSQVNSDNLPRISFYRYEGLFGEANILSGQDF